MYRHKLKKLYSFIDVINMSTEPTVVYTDGSCSPNPGPGGWGFISIHPAGNYHVSGGEQKSTNNRMELMAIIQALQFHANAEHIVIHSDSLLSINCAKGLWRRKENKDLWKIFDRVSKNIEITWVKVKAHNGNKYNELVDDLAKSAMRENTKNKYLVMNKK